MKLSILICSLGKRAASLTRLLDELQKQVTPDVEVLVEIDNGQLTTGTKRNILLQRATGDYICFIDDDDSISDDYVSEILKALSVEPDAVGFEGIITTNGKNPLRWKISRELPYETGYENGQMVYYRFQNHLSPVKRSIALQVLFKDITFQEDYDYALRLKPFIKNEVYIPKELYFYNYQTIK